MKDQLKKIPFAINVISLARKISGFNPEKAFIKKQKKNSPGKISDYLLQHQQKKLHIGCQDHPMESWLNADIHPKHPEVIFMDATQVFPIENDTFSYIYSEHMLEHINYLQGIHFANECLRVLKPGGKLRIATPNLSFLIGLCNDPQKEIHNDYIQFSKRYFLDEHQVTVGRVVNNFFRDWGHQYIHDKESLTYALKNAGFSEIIFKNVGESEDQHLKNLEKHGAEITPTFNVLETIIVEAVK